CAPEVLSSFPPRRSSDLAYSQLTYSPPTPETRGIRLGNFVQIRDVIEEELENIFRGQKTAKQGLDDAVRRSNQLLREFASLYQRSEEHTSELQSRENLVC